MNAIIGYRVAIVTHKVQTTRHKTLGIYTEDDTQLVFIDTPGLFIPRDGHKLEKFIVRNALKAIIDADVILLLVDAYIIQQILDMQDSIASQQAFILSLDEKTRLKLKLYHDAIAVLPKRYHNKIVVIGNKSDTLREVEVLKKQTQNDDNVRCIYNALHLGDNEVMQIILISALQGGNIITLKDHLKSCVKPRMWEFDPELYTSTSERTMAEEMTREQLFLNMHDEIPYAVTVDTDKWDELNDGSIRIFQSIIVLKPSQKNMVIGSGGSMIKKIGEKARIAISSAIGRPVHVFLHVKVRADWIDRLKVV